MRGLVIALGLVLLSCSDPPPMVAPPARALVHGNAFLELPASNRVFDPELYTALGWHLNSDPRSAPTFRYRFDHRAPSRQWYLRLDPPPTGAQAVELVGLAQSIAGPAQASIWIATPSGAPGLEVGLIGLGTDGKIRTIPLLPSGAVVEALDLSWQTYTASFDGTWVGWMAFRIVAADGGRFALSKPTLLAGTEAGGLSRGGARAATEAEAKSLHRLRAWTQEKGTTGSGGTSRGR